MFVYFVFFKQKTAYEMRISDWSSDVCSSDLDGLGPSLASKVANALYFALNFLVRVPTIGNIRAIVDRQFASGVAFTTGEPKCLQIGRASCRERVCQYV